MNYIKFAPNQEVTLLQANSATPAQAIVAAIEFCKANKTSHCDLQMYEGFLIGIEPNSDVNALVKEYREWQYDKQQK